MTKENVLFTIIGVLFGLIVGFMFANSVNQNAVAPVSAGLMKQNSNMPEGHPQIPAGESSIEHQTGAMPEVQAAVDLAKQEPDNFEAQIKAADVYYQIERYEPAIEYLKKANKLKPDNYETLVNLGNAYFDAGRFEEAEKWYSDALAKKADDVNVRTDLGLTFMFRESPDYNRAIRELELSLETNPNHALTLQNITVAYTKKGDAAKAKSTLAQLKSVSSSNPAIPKLGEEIQKLESK